MTPRDKLETLLLLLVLDDDITLTLELVGEEFEHPSSVIFDPVAE
jgi:hypothetical protein